MQTIVRVGVDLMCCKSMQSMLKGGWSLTGPSSAASSWHGARNYLLGVSWLWKLAAVRITGVGSCCA